MATKTKDFLPEVTKDRLYEFELVGPYTPKNYGVGSSCAIYNPIEEKEVAIRYVPGWQSIFVADQPELEERLTPKIDINFANGRLLIPGIKTQYVQYMLLHDKNADNEYSISKKPQFKLVDDTEKLKGVRDLLNAKRKAGDLAADSDFAEAVVYARVVGIDITQAPGEEKKKYEDRIRTRFMEKADTDPVNFIKGFEDPKHKREYDIILAFEQSVITDSYKDGEVNWSDSKVMIVKLPNKQGTITRKFLADWTFTEPGAEFYASLKKQIKY